MGVSAQRTTSGDMEEAVSEGRAARQLARPWRLAVDAVLLGLAGFYLWSALAVPGPNYERGIYVMVTYVVIFLLYPATARSPHHCPSAADLLLGAAAVASIGYWVVHYEELAYRAGAYLPLDFWMGTLALLVSLEVARRVMGWAVAGIGLAAVAYGLLGSYVPGVLGHRGFSFVRIVEYFYLSDEGLFGVMAEVVPKYVLPFVLLGAFMRSSGVGQFLFDLALALAGRSAGGPAKGAVIASALFGSISGSAVANTAATGTFTIPLMKRAGFQPHVAAAVEASASLGGQILPPVMGAAAFVMVELTGIPYLEIIQRAAIPAILYFLSLFVVVHLEARRHNLSGAPPEALPRLGPVLRTGWPFGLPLVVLIVLLYRGHSVTYAALWAIVTTVAVSWLRRESRIGPRELAGACISGMRGSLTIASLLGVIGMLVAVTTLTAIGLKFSNLLIGLAGGRLFLAILLIAVASLLLGTGLPITATYLVIAVLAASALQEMGASLLAAHLLIMWLSQSAELTPPVCMSAFVAAGIAGANPWQTAWTCFKFAKALFVIPFLFIYGHLLLDGSLVESLVAVGAATVGVVAFSAWTMLYLLERTTAVEWVLLLAASVLSLWPAPVANAAGLACLLTVAGLQVRRRRAGRQGVGAAPWQPRVGASGTAASSGGGEASP